MIYNVVILSAIQWSELVYMYVCIYIYIYTHPLLFRFFSHIDHYRVLSRAPYAIQQVLIVFCFTYNSIYMGFPGGSDGKESACNVGDLGSIPGFGRSPGGGQDMATPSSIIDWRIPMDRGDWQATVQRVAKSRTQLND